MTKPILLLAAFAAVLAGCATPSGNDAAATSPSSTATAPGTPVAFRDAEGRLKCPVMGTAIASEKEASGFSDHDGRRYFFCCGACKPKFDADPHQYVKH